jgi:hypothetical protein
MSGKDSELGSTRRGFGLILGGLAAGAILGQTVVANAEDGKEADSTQKRETTRLGSADVQQIDHRDIDSLAAKLDALKLSDNERALLVGLLSVAADTIGSSRTERSVSPRLSTFRSEGAPIGVKAQGPLPSIRDQFRTAFTPGPVRERALDHVGEIIEVHVQ